MDILFHSPGQTATLFLELTDGYGGRVDAPELPTIDRVFLPNLTTASNYPQNMNQLDTGLYYFRLTLPTGATAVGSYLVDASFVNPITLYTNSISYQIIVTAPYGIYSVTTQ